MTFLSLEGKGLPYAKIAKMHVSFNSPYFIIPRLSPSPMIQTKLNSPSGLLRHGHLLCVMGKTLITRFVSPHCEPQNYIAQN